MAVLSQTAVVAKTSLSTQLKCQATYYAARLLPASMLETYGTGDLVTCGCDGSDDQDPFEGEFYVNPEQPVAGITGQYKRSVHKLCREKSYTSKVYVTLGT